ncbi:MAG: ornithine cyclodeaminase family protein [Candidatus Hodarchaeota archaeon]
MSKKGTLLLKRKDLASLMTLQDYIQGIELAFRMHGEGKTFGVDMIHGETPSELEFHIKVGGLQLGENRYYGLKMNASNFNNQDLFGLPNIMGVVLLYEGVKGIPLAVVDAGDPTRKRTGAATAVAAKYLARKNSKVVTICGCGTQGRIQLKALKEVLPIEKVFGYDINTDLAAEYAQEMTEELDIEISVVTDLKTSLQVSDVLVTCTPSKSPYIKREYVRSGTFIAAVGADSPDKQELDETLLKDNKIVTDVTKQCARAGELHHALDKKLITLADVHGQLGEVICGKVTARENDDEIVIYDATGTALQDVAAAALYYEKALKTDQGQYINFFEE